MELAHGMPDRSNGVDRLERAAVPGAGVRAYVARPTRRAVLRGSVAGLAAFGVASLLEACAAGGTPPPPAETAPATVQFYFGTAGAPEIQLYTTLKEGFEKQYPKYKMDLLPAENEIEKALAMMAAGTPPDVYWNRQRNSQVLIRRDALSDISSLMKRDKMTLDDYWPSAVKTYTYKGGFYGLPTSASSNAVYFNKLHFKQVGATLPTDLQKQGKWDWDALVETARKLTRTDASGKKFWGFLRPSGLTLNVQYMWQNGGKPFSDDRTQCLVNSPECVAAEQWITDLVLKHQVSPPVVDPTGADFRKNNMVAMEQAGRYLLPDAVPAMQSGAIDMGMVVAPKGPKNGTTRGDDLAASILKSTKVLEAAWAWAKYWASDEGQLAVLKSNRSYTSRRSIAKNPAILKQVLNDWEDADAYFTGLNLTDMFPVTPKFPQVTDAFNAEEKAAHAGDKPVKQAMDAAAQQIAPMLKEAF